MRWFATIRETRTTAQRDPTACICGNPAEFWLWRLFAFELRRWGYAARTPCHDWSSCACVVHRTASRRTPLLTFALDFHRKESVCGGHGPSLTGSLLSRLASAGFGRWRRDVAPARLRGVWHVKEQTCAVHQTARWFQNPIVIVAVMRKMITTLNAMLRERLGSTVTAVGAARRPHGSRCAERFGRVKAVAARSAGARSTSLDAAKSISDLPATR